MPKIKSPMRVWWIPQIPGKPFHVEVGSVKEALKIHKTLADYDKFQFDNRIKPDYSNIGGLEVLDGAEWVEYFDEVTGDDIAHALQRVSTR